MKRILFITAAVATLLVVPLFAFAGQDASGNITFPHWGPLVTCSASAGSAHPCQSICDIFKTAQSVIYFALTILLFVIAPIMFVIGGFLVLVGGASPESVGQGRKILLGTAIGVALGVGAFVIVGTFLWLLGNKASPTGESGVAWPQIVCTPNNPLQ